MHFFYPFSPRRRNLYIHLKFALQKGVHCILVTGRFQLRKIVTEDKRHKYKCTRMFLTRGQIYIYMYIYICIYRILILDQFAAYFF